MTVTYPMESDSIEMREEENHAGPEFYQGLLKAQMAIKAVSQDAQTTGGAIYHYASTENVMREGRKALHAGKLVFIRGRVKTYAPREGANAFMVVTYFRIAHTSGQWVEFSLGIPAFPNRGMGPDKATGSAVTYATRYAMIGILCLPRVEKGADPEEHNDQAMAQKSGPPRMARQAPPPQAPAQQQWNQSEQQAQQQPRQPFRRSSTSWDPEDSKKMIQRFWSLIGDLGDQPPASNLEKAFQDGVDAVQAIGRESKVALIAAMLRIENAIRQQGTEPERPKGAAGKPIDDLAKLSNAQLIGYAETLRSVADIVLGGTHVQETQAEE